MADTNTRTQGGRSSGSQQNEARPGNQAQQEGARGDRQQAGGAEAIRAEEAARAAVGNAQESFQRGANVATRGMEDVASNLAEQTRRTTGSMKDAMEIHRDTVHSAAEDFRAATTAATVSVEGMIKIDTAVVDLVGQSAEATARVSQQLLGARTPRDVADAQREYTEALMRSWIDGSALILRATQEIAERALEPINERMGRRVRA
jgi:hypothetical protein